MAAAASSGQLTVRKVGPADSENRTVARTLHTFEASGYPATVAAVGERVHIDLDGFVEELVDEDRPFGGGFDGVLHIGEQVFLVVDDFHGAAAEDV